jgi:serine/threonine protein phosphatase PrpC
LNKSLGGKALEVDDKIGYRAGTTLALLLLTKDKFYMANAGDSSVILSRNNQAVALSNDHKPDLPL